MNLECPKDDISGKGTGVRKASEASSAVLEQGTGVRYENDGRTESRATVELIEETEPAFRRAY
jgi:hypothetical protein